MKIVVIGTGYVGLVTGTCFAEVGMNVICVDIDVNKIKNLREGVIPIYEPGLEQLINKNFKTGRLHFSTSLKESILGADVVFIAVGTPTGADGSADLKNVIAVAAEIGNYMHSYAVIVTKSTVPVGTAIKVNEAIKLALDKREKSIKYDVASNPEFLKEGAAIDDFLKPDRIVVGVSSRKAEEVITKLYKPFLVNGHPIIFMDIISAEMTKYAANSMLATKISFMNDIANLCDCVGADVNMVRKGIGSDSRIGNKFIYPGIGYGGSCFPKDIKALIKTAAQNGYRMQILEAVEAVNEQQKSVLFDKIMNRFQGNIKGRKFAMWGLSFKPNTDDMREAPSLVLIDRIIDAGGSIQAFDPVAMNETKHIIGDTIKYFDTEYEALQGTDALLIITEWADFRSPDFNRIKKSLLNPIIFDGRNIYDSKELNNLGFEYYGIGTK
ncbi:MAG: UDP-glucose/GDP-mannose dehydrogenase family protein [Flavobacteriaceae bacterium]